MVQWYTIEVVALILTLLHSSFVKFSNVLAWKEISQPGYGSHAVICTFSHIYWVNNLPYHMGVWRGGPIIIASAHPLTLVCCFHLTTACLCARVNACVLWATHLKGFSWFMISAQNPNELNRREDRERERRERERHEGRAVTWETEMSEGWDGKKKKKQNAGQASKDYCMKVV